MADLPFKDCCEHAESAQRLGYTVYQKFTCAFCGSRQTMDIPDVFFKQGACEECGKVTAIFKCGYLAIIGVGNERRQT